MVAPAAPCLLRPCAGSASEAAAAADGGACGGEAGALAAAPAAGGASRRALLALASAVFAMNLGMGMQGTVYTNFAVQELHIRASQLGLVEAIRESSGLLCFVVMGLAARFALPRLAAAALALMGGGIMLLTGVHGVPALALASFIWGVGFHTFSPISPALTLALGTDHAHRAGLLGRLSGIGSVAGPVGTFAVLVTLPLLGLRGQFLPAGAFVLVAALLMLAVRGPRSGPRPRFVVRRRYVPFYVLTLMDGARKQILITFAVFAVVSVYHASVVTVGLFLLASSLLATLSSPYVGRLIAAHGERAVLMVSSLLMVPIFCGYGLTSSEAVMIALYILDNALFTSNVALTTWVSRHAPPEDVPATLAAGTTANHVASVVVPLVAGFLWQAFGYRLIFLGAAGVAVVTLALVLWLLPPRAVERGALTAGAAE